MTRDLLQRVVVPARLALICRGRETLGYNPEFNVWHRMDETAAEVLRWLRAGRERSGLQNHLERRFGLAPDAAREQVQQITEWHFGTLVPFWDTSFILGY